jgi:putative membrane protein
MSRIHVGLICACLATPALGASMSEKMGVNSALGVSPSTADFVSEAAVSDMFEIQSSELAMARSDDATKSFAQQMINDHQKTTSDIKGMVDSKAVHAAIPPTIDSAHNYDAGQAEQPQWRRFYQTVSRRSGQRP